MILYIKTAYNPQIQLRPIDKQNIQREILERQPLRIRQPHRRQCKRESNQDTRRKRHQGAEV